jgi:hypothetical protein
MAKRSLYLIFGGILVGTGLVIGGARLVRRYEADRSFETPAVEVPQLLDPGENLVMTNGKTIEKAKMEGLLVRVVDGDLTKVVVGRGFYELTLEHQTALLNSIYSYEIALLGAGLTGIVVIDGNTNREIGRYRSHRNEIEMGDRLDAPGRPEPAAAP